MSSTKLELRGAVVIQPQTTSTASSGSRTLPINFDDSPAQTGGQEQRSIVSPSAFVDLLTGSGIVTATFVAINVLSGQLTVRFTTTAGADQLEEISGLWVRADKLTTAGITALAVQGTATIAYMLAGTAS